MNQITVIFIFAGLGAAFLVALLVTPVIRKFAVRIGAVDIPKDERRMHSKPIPTIGGLAIFIAFALAVLIFVNAYGKMVEGSNYQFMDAKYIALLCGALVIVIVGILDDIYGLRWWVKLLGQVFAALIVVMNGITITEIATGDIGMFAIPATVLWIVAITNAINLIDGLDGLACGIVGISCVSLLIVSTFSIRPDSMALTIVIAILAGACFGFLPYNTNPAKIFMGDTGAMFIGFTLSVISIQGFFKVNALVSFGVPFLVLALPILDTLMALFRRLVKGRNPFKPDKKHMHHKFIGWGFNQRETVGIMYGISAMMGFAAILFSRGAQLTPTIMASEVITDAVVEASTPEMAQQLAAQAANELTSTRDALMAGGILVMVAAFVLGLILVNLKRRKLQKNENTGEDALNGDTE